MANLRQFLSTNKTVELKAKKVFNSILSDYNSGKIKSDTEFLYRVKNDLMDFYNSISNPSFKPYYATGTPLSSEFSKMVDSAISDIETAISECTNLDQAITSSFKDVGMSEQTLSLSMKMVNKVIADLKDSVYSFTNNNTTNYTDSFDEDVSSTSSESAFVNTKECILTLPIDTVTDNSNKMSVEVVSSNGFPGNTHMIEPTRTGIVFDGESNMRNDVRASCDRNKESWLEYELFQLGDEEYNKCNGLGFTYKEGVSWVTDEDELKLHVRFTPNKKELKCNWFSIEPFIPSNKSYVPAIIEKIVVSDSTSNVQYIPVGRAFDDTVIVTFEEQSISTVDVFFKQQNPYSVDIGHVYTVKLNNSNVSIYDNAEDNIYNRVDMYKPSVSSLGVKYDPKTGHITHGSHKAGSDDYLESDPADIFKLPNTDAGYKHGIEVIKANRFMIGIKDISIAKYSFKEEGVYISKSFGSDSEITSVTLNSIDSTPTNFEDGQYVRYYVTFDEGTTWHQIFSKDRAYLGPCTIRINSDEAPYDRADVNRIKYIDRLLETKSIKVKIELKKPKGSSYTSPIVYSYRLDVRIGDDKFDS